MTVIAGTGKLLVVVNDEDGFDVRAQTSVIPVCENSIIKLSFKFSVLSVSFI